MPATAEPLATAAPPASVPTIRLLVHDASGAIRDDWPLGQIREALDDPRCTVWVDIEDTGPDIAAVEPLLRDVFGFHPLAIEDALKEAHIAKLDDWGPYLYLVFHTLDFDAETDDIRLHELDIFLGARYLVTYHTEPLRVLDLHRANILRDPRNRMKDGADHLLYHLLDLAVSEYLPAIEHLDDAIDTAQDEVFARANPRTLQKIFRIKRSATHLHRVLSPQREVLNRLARDPLEAVDPKHRVYFRDVYDHIVRTHDITEGLRDLIASSLDTYLSVVSNRTNEIMKTLTLVTVMFMPMSFLASFWGMNFFGENIAMAGRLPAGLYFWGSCLLMVATPWLLWLWSRHRGWF